jgi:hypothetical protein
MARDPTPGVSREPLNKYLKIMGLRVFVCVRTGRTVEKEGRNWVAAVPGRRKCKRRAWRIIARLSITVNNYYLVVPFEWRRVRIGGSAREVEEKKEVRVEKSGMGRALRRILRNVTEIFRTIEGVPAMARSSEMLQEAASLELIL